MKHSTFYTYQDNHNFTATKITLKVHYSKRIFASKEFIFRFLFLQDQIFIEMKCNRKGYIIKVCMLYAQNEIFAQNIANQHQWWMCWFLTNKQEICYIEDILYRSLSRIDMKEVNINLMDVTESLLNFYYVSKRPWKKTNCLW